MGARLHHPAPGIHNLAQRVLAGVRPRIDVSYDAVKFHASSLRSPRYGFRLTAHAYNSVVAS